MYNGFLGRDEEVPCENIHRKAEREKNLLKSFIRWNKKRRLFLPVMGWLGLRILDETGSIGCYFFRALYGVGIQNVLIMLLCSCFGVQKWRLLAFVVNSTAPKKNVLLSLDERNKIQLCDRYGKRRAHYGHIIRHLRCASSVLHALPSRFISLFS